MAVDRSPDEAPEAPAWLRFLTAVESAILVLTLLVMLGLAVAQIVLRNFLDTGLMWGDALLRVMVLWIGMIGAIAASRDDRQITVDVLSRFMGEARQRWARLVTDLFTAGVSGLLAWHAGRLVLEERGSGMTAFASVPVWVCELILPVAFALIAVRYAALFVSRLRRPS